MIVRNADGTVDHDGEFNPWEMIDADEANSCRNSGGFVMRIGTCRLGRSTVRFDHDTNAFIYSSEPSRYSGDGLMYVHFA